MGQRLDHIHGLRGIAAMAVIAQHATQMVQNAGLPHYGFLLDHINLGRFGVVLFFLISGLVIPFSFRGETPLRNFAISRFFRLYPAYWLSIPALSYIVVAEYHGDNLGLGTILANITMLQSLLGEPDIGPGYWTLGLEMIFYILCGVLCWRKRLDDVVLNALIVLLCLVVMLEPLGSWMLTGDAGFMPFKPFFIGMFFLGMLLRRVFVDGCEIARRWALFLVPLAMFTGIATSGFFYPSFENTNVYLAPIPLAAGMVLPIAVFALVLWLRPVPGRWVMYLGTVSYSLYLFQDIGLIFLQHLFPPGEWPFGYVLAVIALTLAIASAVYRFVELPMIEIGRKLIRKGSSRTTLQPAA